MRTPYDVCEGRIVGYDERAGELLIRVPYDDYLTLTKREYKKCKVQLIDSRPLSSQQRKMCYALIREIADYSGMGDEMTKEYMKLKFLTENVEETADEIFSLADAPMSLVCAFQRFLIRLILDYDIPCRIPLLNYVDDIQDYIYACLIHKKCCICGRYADLHHVDRVGMGRDRTEIVHEGMKALPLCREHHQEVDQIGDTAFYDKYHIIDGIPLDKTLCKIYRLKGKDK